MVTTLDWGGGGEEVPWIMEVVPETRALKWLIMEGLRVERARDLIAEAVAVCATKECPKKPEAYFWRVLRNLLNRYVRDEAGRTEPLLEEPPARGPTPEERTSRVELDEEVEKVLAELPEHVAAVARLHLADWSLADAARELGLPPSTARSYWKKAKVPLQEFLRRLGFRPETEGND